MKKKVSVLMVILLVITMGAVAMNTFADDSIQENSRTY